MIYLITYNIDKLLHVFFNNDKHILQIFQKSINSFQVSLKKGLSNISEVKPISVARTRLECVEHNCNAFAIFMTCSSGRKYHYGYARYHVNKTIGFIQYRSV